MAFTSWDAIISDLKDKLADFAAGNPLTQEYRIGTRTHVIRSADDIERLLMFCIKMKGIESPARRTSYGRPRRFQ
jgi:hypothetical protein